MPSFCSGDNAKRMNKKFRIIFIKSGVEILLALLFRFQIIRHVVIFNAEFVHLCVC